MNNAFAQLQELFPHHSSLQIRNALLTCSTAGIDAAAEILLQQEPAPAADHKRCSQSSAKAVSVMPLTNKQQAKPSWAALRSSHSQQPTHQATHQGCSYTSSCISSSRSAQGSPAQPTPVYVNRRGSARPIPPNLVGDAFPALGAEDTSDPAADTSDATAAASITAAAKQQQQQPAMFRGSTSSVLQERHEKNSATRHLSDLKRSSSATSFAEVARKQQQQLLGVPQLQQQQHHHGDLQLQLPRLPKSPITHASSRQGDMGTAVAQLEVGMYSHSSHNSKQQQQYNHRHHHQPPPQTPQQQQQQHHHHHQQCDLRHLAELHPWCEPELLQEVLSSVHHDTAAAAAALLQMAPAGPEGQAGSSSSSASSSRTSSRPSSPLLGTLGGCQAGSHGLTLTAAHSTSHSETQSEMHSATHGTSTGAIHGAPTGIAGGHAAEREQQLSDSPTPELDVYHAIRGEALRLTRQWQKLLRRSAAAYAAGDRSAAKHLSTEAKAMKEAADAAHASAALKIEIMHNMSSSAGLWELDLHGLHVKEALTALQQRLELLQSIVQDFTAQPPHTTVQPPKTAATNGMHSGEASHSSSATGVPTNLGCTKQQVLKQLLLSEQQPLHLQQAALSQQLRVIVGKGNNSSGGEASLPRAVESWLNQKQYKHVLRAGAIDVKLKRFYQQQM